MDNGELDWRGINLANWNERVPVHLASKLYDLDGFRAGACSLRPFEVAEMGEVAGKRLAHLQCHIGLDTLSWARLGARVSGLDFSPPAIEAASALARDLGVEASFVVSDVYDAVPVLGGAVFDIVYTGIGALVWLPDIPRWASVVASLLTPGGFLYLVEGHPYAQILDEEGERVFVASDYFDSSPQVEDWPYTYTDGPPLSHATQVEFQHSLGAIVTALTGAGLRIEFLHEWDFGAFARFESMKPDSGGRYRLPAGRPRVPQLYSLRAARM